MLYFTYYMHVSGIKCFYDLGVVHTKEPFQKLFNQGMILGEGHVKMSKSLGNVINPDDIVASHGALYVCTKCLCTHLMHQKNGQQTEWTAHAALDRVWRLFMNEDGTLSAKK